MLELLEGLRKEAEKKGAAAEIYSLTYEVHEIELTDGRTKKAERKQEAGFAVRVIKDGRLGFSAAAGAEPPSDLVNRAIASARLGGEAKFQFPQKAEPQKRITLYDEKTKKFTFNAAREVGELLCARLKERYPDALVEASVYWGWADSLLVNSSGAVCEQHFTRYGVGAMVQQVSGEEITIVFCSKRGLTPNEEFGKRVAEVIVERLDAASRPATISSGPKKVLFDPMYGVMSILTPLWVALNGENVARKSSPLHDKIGQRLFSDMLTVVDDPLEEGGGECFMWDGEGVAARRNVLIEEGVVCNFVFDLENAARAGMTPTGSAQRTLLSRPKPGFSNFIIEPGNTPLKEIIASIDEGVYVINPLAAWGANPLSGQFSTPLGLALKIEKGEIVGRLKQVSIAGNIYEDLKKVVAVSRETEWFGGKLIPHILLDGVNVTAK